MITCLIIIPVWLPREINQVHSILRYSTYVDAHKLGTVTTLETEQRTLPNLTSKLGLCYPLPNMFLCSKYMYVCPTRYLEKYRVFAISIVIADQAGYPRNDLSLHYLAQRHSSELCHPLALPNQKQSTNGYNVDPPNLAYQKIFDP